MRIGYLKSIINAVYLSDYTALSRSCREDQSGFQSFRSHPQVIGLHWPDDVLEQWLYDHAGNASFLVDYARLDLSLIRWGVEAVSTEALIRTPTGDSDAGCIDEYAKNPDHWIGVRKYGVHKGVASCWEKHGTWQRRPLLIDRSLVDSFASGLQVVEGRTRVGILKGRHLNGDLVSAQHQVWVGRPRAGTVGTRDPASAKGTTDHRDA